jgi:hypothetical protein
MTFALTKVRAYGIAVEQPCNKRYVQRLVLDITAAATDLTLALGSHVAGALGTFWDAVDGTEPGDSALKAIRDIVSRADAFVSVGGIGVQEKVRGTAAASGVYSQTVTNKCPNLVYNTAEAPTAYTLVLEWVLKDGAEPVSLVATSAAQSAA